MTSDLSNSPLPKDQMPLCWSDDVRMTALFAPFRIKSVNPTDYDSKMKFWVEMITKWSHNKGSHTYDDIRSAFQRNGKYPACLETVMENMIKEGKLCPKCQMQTSPEGWMRWGLSALVRPAAWATSTLMGGGAKVDRTQQYVHLDAVKDQAQSFMSSIPLEMRLGSKEELWRASCNSGRPIQGDQLDVILNWLMGQGLAMCSPDGKLYKLSLDGTSKVRPFTEGELCLPRLEVARRNLERSIEEMKKKSDETRFIAKQSLAKGEKSMALSHLRSKKMIETRMEKAVKNLDSITHLIDSVKQAHSDSEVLDAFKTGLNALKTTMKQKGLEEDNVFDTMDDIKDTLDIYSDIETAISQPIGMTFDKEELEMELEELIAMEQREEGGNNDGGNVGKESKGVPNLPEAPNTTLGEESDDFHKAMEKRLKNLRLTS